MNLKSIIVCNNRLSERQVVEQIARFESMRKLTREQRIRLWFLHNTLNERLWKKDHPNA